MSTVNDEDETRQPLLDDAAFAQLMQAEYARQAADAGDHLQRERIWRRIQTRAAWRRWRAWLPAAAAAVLVLALAPLLQSEQDGDLRRKGDAATEQVVFLQVQVLGADGQTLPLGPALHPGDTLVFSSKVSRPGSVALAMAGGDSVPGIRFSADNHHPGVWQRLQRDGQAYGYRIEAGDSTLRFCLIGADTSGDLQQRSSALADLWPYLPASACAVINAGG